MRIYYAASLVSVSLLPLLLIIKILIMKRNGVKAVRFGERDKKDFIIVPFAALYFYFITAAAFDLPTIGSKIFYRYYVHWYGSALCFTGIIFIASALIISGKSFRVGIDEDSQKTLITKGPYAINRNPVYTGMLFIFAGVFITYANWVFIAYIVAGFLVIHRQILKEEKSCEKVFGAEYDEYRSRVGRYF